MTGFLYAGLALALLGAAALVAFESPVRSAGALITSFVGAAAAAGALGVSLLPGTILWVGGAAIGLLLLSSVLLLNLGDDERGPRRFRVRPAFAAPALAAVWTALAGVLLDAIPPSPAAPPTSAAVAQALLDDLAVPLCAGLIAVAVATMTAIALVRRRT